MSEYTAIFVENRDNPRFLKRCNNKSKYINAVIFSFIWEGIPVFYYGGEQFFHVGIILKIVKLYGIIIILILNYILYLEK